MRTGRSADNPRDSSAEAMGANQRGPALAERNDGVFIGWEHGSVAPHRGGPVGNVAPPPFDAERIEIGAYQQRAAALAQVGHGARVQPFLTKAALQIRSFWH